MKAGLGLTRFRLHVANALIAIQVSTVCITTAIGLNALNITFTSLHRFHTSAGRSTVNMTRVLSMFTNVAGNNDYLH